MIHVFFFLCSGEQVFSTQKPFCVYARGGKKNSRRLFTSFYIPLRFFFKMARKCCMPQTDLVYFPVCSQMTLGCCPLPLTPYFCLFLLSCIIDEESLHNYQSLKANVSSTTRSENCTLIMHSELEKQL